MNNVSIFFFFFFFFFCYGKFLSPFVYIDGQNTAHKNEHLPKRYYQ